MQTRADVSHHLNRYHSETEQFWVKKEIIEFEVIVICPDINLLPTAADGYSIWF